MRLFVTAATVLAVCGLLTVTAARAGEPKHEMGGAIKSGNLCWVSASANDTGYWKECPKPAKMAKSKKKKKKS